MNRQLAVLLCIAALGASASVRAASERDGTGRAYDSSQEQKTVPPESADRLKSRQPSGTSQMPQQPVGVVASGPFDAVLDEALFLKTGPAYGKMGEPPLDPKTRYPVIKSGDYFSIRLFMREKLAKPRSPEMKAKVFVYCGAAKLMDGEISVGTLPNTAPKNHKGDYGPNYQIHSTADRTQLCELRATLVPVMKGLKDQNPADNTYTAAFLLSARPRSLPQQESKSGKIPIGVSAVNDFDVAVTDIRLIDSSTVEIPSPLPVDPQTKQPMVRSGKAFGIMFQAREKLAAQQSPEMNARILVTCGASKLLDETRPVGQIPKTQKTIHQINLSLKNTSTQAMTCDLQVTLAPKNQGPADKNPADNTVRTTFSLASASTSYHQAGKLALAFDVEILKAELRTQSPDGPPPVDPETKQPVVESNRKYRVQISGREKLAEKSPTMRVRYRITCGAQVIFDETDVGAVGFKNDLEPFVWIMNPISVSNPSAQAITCDLRVTLIPYDPGLKDQNPSDNTARITFRLLAEKKGLKSDPAMQQPLKPETEKRSR